MSTIRPGSMAYWKNEPCLVLELKGLTEAVIRTVLGQVTHIVRASELTSTPVAETTLRSSHVFAENHSWGVAMERYELIRPLLVDGRKNLQDVKDAAAASGKSVTTIYRWIKRFEETGLVSSLLRSSRSDKGQRRVDEEVEFVIGKSIEAFFLSNERPKVTQLHKEIESECRALGIEAPHINTIHQRVRAIDERERHRRRLGPRSAKQKHQPLRGEFPAVDSPNAVVQIDHTPVDVIVVDEENRLPVGRPYLTMSIDVRTRMISGFRLTLDPPGAASAAMCIAHAVTKKDYWLAKRDIPAEWPIYGLMQKIHVDNAKEFKGRALSRGCEEYGITLENRPKGQPNYGPHVERAFRTFMTETHRLRGTTFSNIQEKLEYNSEGKACLTLDELELWLTLYIVYVYHNSPHEGLNGASPINFYSKCVLGTQNQPGVGLPEAIENEEKFRLDFTPYYERTVQRHGVELDNIYYYAPVLRTRIAEKDGNGKGRKFIFVRDPRDISVVYLLDPDEKIYYPIPYFNGARPVMSLWELREVTRRLREDSSSKVDEQSIFEGYQRMRSIEAEAIERTRLAVTARASEKRKRRMAARRKGWEGAHASQPNPNEPLAATFSEEITIEEIQPYEEIEIG